jgi:hypothetical protein
LLACDGVMFVRSELIGKDGRHRAVYLTDGSNTGARAVWWRSAHLPEPPASAPLLVRFQLSRDLSRKRGQITIHSFAAHPAGPATDTETETEDSALADARSGAAFAVLDLRPLPDWRTRLEQVVAEHGAGAVLRWPEAPAQRAHVLVLMQAPPGPDELGALLATAQPQLVVLPPLPVVSESRQRMLDQARALLRAAEQRGDDINEQTVLERMAARIKQRPATVRAAFGVITGEPGAELTLDYLLAETAGYRALFRDKPAESLLRSG